MDSLQEILSGRQFKAPDEISAVKEYIQHTYKSASRVRSDKDAIILSVPNSALAATLQLEKQKLVEACGISKRLVIRIGR